MRLPESNLLNIKPVLFFLLFSILLIIGAVFYLDESIFYSPMEFYYELTSVAVISAIAIASYSVFRLEPLALAGMSLFIFQKSYRVLVEVKVVREKVESLPELFLVLIDDGSLLLGIVFLAVGVKHILHFYEMSECIDELTTVFNRKAFNKIKMMRFDLVFFDLDDFKRLNDNQGHKFGDSVLILFSHHLNKQCVNNEMIIRFGGDEFIAVIRPSRTEEFLKQISKELEATKIKYSYGIARNVDRRELREGISRADASLYQMKLEKKSKKPVNQVVTYSASNV